METRDVCTCWGDLNEMSVRGPTAFRPALAELETAMTACVFLSVSFCETPYSSMARAPEWLFLASKGPKKQGLGERSRTRGQSGEGSAARHPEWLPASEPRRPFHPPAATSGRSNDRVNMHTVLASCSISHYDPIFF